MGLSVLNMYLESGPEVGGGCPVETEAGGVDAEVGEEEEDGAELGDLVEGLDEEEAGDEEGGGDHGADGVPALRLGVHHPAMQNGGELL